MKDNNCTYRDCKKETSEKGLCSEHYKTQAEIDAENGIPEMDVSCCKCGAKKNAVQGRFYKSICAKCRAAHPAREKKENKHKVSNQNGKLARQAIKAGKKQTQITCNESAPGEVEGLISVVCDGIKKMLLTKNRLYGNSALNPQRVFSKADTMEQLNVRIDDKISRIKSGQMDDTEDAELDLIGYLILKRVARSLTAAQ
ncbi:hypothetical protein EPN18_10065 [bacterium]|nr:MAG: hypothetical protein EPN18_10065 [bacterium]